MKTLLLLISLLLAPTAHAASPPDAIALYAISLIDNPYRLGGISPETGLDCSGFVGHVFRQTTGVILPRDSRAISESTQALTPAELEPGDLVFFNTLDRAFSHVGIYLGDGRFVHAPSSRSGAVMISSLNAPYWKARYDGARRVVLKDPDSSSMPAAMPVAE